MKQISLARQIGLVVRQRRQKLKITQQQLADEAEVSRGFISRLEKGASVAVYPEKLLDVLEVLGLSLWIDDSGVTDDACDKAYGTGEGSRASESNGGDMRHAGGKGNTRGGSSRQHAKRSKARKHSRGNDEIAPLQIDAALLKPFKPRQEAQHSAHSNQER